MAKKKAKKAKASKAKARRVTKPAKQTTKKLKAKVTIPKDGHLKAKAAVKLLIARPSGPKDEVGKEVRIFMPTYKRSREVRVYIFTDSMVHCDMKGLVQHPGTKQWLHRVFKGKGAKNMGLDAITTLRKQGHDCTMVIRTGFEVKYSDMTHSFAPITGLAAHHAAPAAWSA